MRYFVAISEDAMLRLWLRNPELLKPFSRPFHVRPALAKAANDSSACLVKSESGQPFPTAKK